MSWLDWETCPMCDGDGDLRVDDPMGLGEDIFELCPECHGEGILSDDPSETDVVVAKTREAGQ